LKKYICKTCQSQVIGFPEDVEVWLQSGSRSVVYQASPESGCIAKNLCDLEEVIVSASAIHGEAGFATEGTMLDSVSSIHEVEAQKISEAELEREGKAYQKAKIEK
jgi:hypothetical protein